MVVTWNCLHKNESIFFQEQRNFVVPYGRCDVTNTLLELPDSL